MTGPIWKRPSAYVALCAATVISVFVARGDLRIERDGVLRTGAGAVTPRVVHNNLPGPVGTSERAQLAGLVLDAQGFPVVDAAVSAAGESVRTGRDGTFVMRPHRAALFDVEVRAEGYRTLRIRRTFDMPGPLLAQLEPSAPWDEAVAVGPEPVLTGEGTVRDRDGRPVIGAYVTAAGSGLWSLTDAIGRYTLPLLDASPTLVVHRPAGDGGPALAARSGPHQLPRASGVVPLPELVADEGASIFGRLTGADGSPLIGVPVTITGDGFAHSCESDGSGRYAMAGLVDGVYAVVPMAFGGAVGRAHEVVLEGEAAECDLRLERPAPRKVQICNDDGLPVGNALVAVLVAGRRREVARAGADGFAELRLATGPVEFEVRSGESLEALAVHGLDQEQGRLLVAAP